MFKAFRSEGGFLHLKCAREAEDASASPASWLLLSVNPGWVPDDLACEIVEDAAERLRPHLEAMTSEIRTAEREEIRRRMRLLRGGKRPSRPADPA